nr:integrase, catalytic region, zinc finger, CCHC-type, peptidase aspartic, catalytic [Tanacetum cinerariifolium]
MQASLQGKDNAIRQLKMKLSQLQVTRSDTDRTLRVQTIDSQITKLTDHVTHLQAQNDLFRAENDKIKQHYKELYDSIKITRAKHIEQVTKSTAKNLNLKTCVSKATVNPQVSARDKHAIYVKPIVPRLRNNRDAQLDYLRPLKKSVETIHDIVEEAKVVRPLDRSIVSACRYTKHSQELLEYAIGTCRTDRLLVFGFRLLKTYDGDHSRLLNFVKKFIGTVRFGNDHFGAIMGYGDYVVGESFISRVYYVEGVGHNLFSVGQFCDSDLEVAFRKHSCYVRNTDGVDLIKGSRGSNLYIGTVRFGNDHFGAIMGYGDYVVGESFISRVYYVEGVGHNLFSVGQFCDSDLEVAFRKHSCYVRNTDGVDLIKGSRGSNLYTISVEDMMKS